MVRSQPSRIICPLGLAFVLHALIAALGLAVTTEIVKTFTQTLKHETVPKYT